MYSYYYITDRIYRQEVRPKKSKKRRNRLYRADFKRKAYYFLAVMEESKMSNSPSTA